MRMKLRLAIGSSLVTLALLSSVRADQPPTRLTADAEDTTTSVHPGTINSPTAGTIVQIAAVTQQIAQITSTATVATDEPPKRVAAPAGPAGGNHLANEKHASKADKAPISPAGRVQVAAAEPQQTLVRPIGKTETGTAAWYGGHYIGQRTSSGTRLDSVNPTCAHRTLPLNSLVRVTNLKNGRSVVVRVTDRGPVSTSLLIDMSPRAADELRMKEAGLVPVKVEQVVEVSPGSK
jgi:rare lipoprotein A (peptidoglycan hydrolase)